MSLWSDYYSERLGWLTIEEPDGFVLFALNPPTATIEDIYVAPHARKSNLALSLANRVSAFARNEGCTELVTQVWPGTKGAEHAVRINIAYGFKMIGAENGRIIFKKELGGADGK